MKVRRPCVYILASRRNGTLYVGVTSDLIQRIGEHKAGTTGSFTKRYGVDLFVFFEIHETMEAAITREKQIKKWNRAWKIRRIEIQNPEWLDLFERICS